MNRDDSRAEDRGRPGSALRKLAPVASLVVGAILVFSALTKFLNPRAFLATIGDYGLFPDGFILPLGTGLAGLEFALGLMLVTGIARRFAARVSIPVVLVFTLFVVRAWQTGMTECGCFGEVISLPPLTELVVDLVLLALLFVVVRGGEDFRIGGSGFSTTFGWVVFCVGAVIFLARGPVVDASEELDLVTADLSILQRADPPLDIPEDAFLFFFSADCDHCWAYAGGVELMAQRVEGLSVHGITLSDPAAMDAFREAFAPTYPIHTLSPRQFNALVDTYPSGVWVQGGEVAQTWAGFVPGLREVAEAGGYLYRSGEPVAGEEELSAPAPAPESTPGRPNFGGTLGGRQ